MTEQYLINLNSEINTLISRSEKIKYVEDFETHYLQVQPMVCELLRMITKINDLDYVELLEVVEKSDNKYFKIDYVDGLPIFNQLLILECERLIYKKDIK